MASRFRSILCEGLMSGTHYRSPGEEVVHRSKDRQVALALLRRVRPRQECRDADNLAARRTALDAIQLYVVLLQQTGRELILVRLDLRLRLLVYRVGERRELAQGGKRETEDASCVQSLSERTAQSMSTAVGVERRGELTHWSSRCFAFCAASRRMSIVSKSRPSFSSSDVKSVTRVKGISQIQRTPAGANE